MMDRHERPARPLATTEPPHAMRGTRRIGPTVLLSLLLVVWLTSGLSLATEPGPVTPDPVPALHKPRGAVRAGPPTGKGHPPARARVARPPARAPKPPATIIGPDGAPMVLVPAGEFPMGSEEGDDDEQPIHRVFLNSYYLDKFEVTNGRFAKFVAAIQSEPPWGFA
ncbi:MAG: formylglycine-generating enzyme family protein, partial [Candidatus Methylomirabilales bacterium]